MKTREWLEKLGVPRLKESLDGLPRQIADLRARLEASQDESERAALRAHIEGLEAYQKEMTPPRVTLPTMTFDRRLVIHRGGREIHLLFLGRAHTAGDVVAYIPSERVIATGDLMHGLLPYMGDGFPDEWPATLRALEALEFDRVIPGHGSIQEGKSVLAQFRGYVEEITEKVARGVERGQPLDELKKTITPDSLASLKAERHASPRRARAGGPLPGPGEARRDARRQRHEQCRGKSSPISRNARASASSRSGDGSTPLGPPRGPGRRLDPCSRTDRRLASRPSCALVVLLGPCSPCLRPSAPGEPLPALTREQASAFARLALKGLGKEYPNKPEHVMAGPRRREGPEGAPPGVLRLLRLALVRPRPLDARPAAPPLPRPARGEGDPRRARAST